MPFDAQTSFNEHPILPDNGDTKNSAPPIEDAPDHWIQDHFLVDGIPISYYVARAEKELGVIVGCSGLKSNNPLSIAVVNILNSVGISVIMMALPNPERNLGFMPHFRKVFERFALDENSPVHTIFPKDLPKFLYGHSTGGLLALRTVIKTALFDKFENMGYKQAPIEAPFSDTAGASLHHSSWLARTAFNAYAYWHKNKLPKETLGGLWYLHHSENKIKLHEDKQRASRTKKINLPLAHFFNTTVEALRDISDYHLSKINNRFPDASTGLKIPLAALYTLHSNIKNVADSHMLKFDIKPTAWFLAEGDKRTPTYGQILEDRHAGRKFYTRLNKKMNSETAIPVTIITAIPVTIIASDDDPFSCTATTREQVAKPLQATLHQSEGLHNPISEDSMSLQYLIDEITPDLLDEPLKDRTVEKTPSRWSIFTSGSRFARALKRTTGFLNPITSLSKSFLGRGVGNPEMGAEAESRAVDTGHALSL
jgi:alpha-beta hydrolase superfamily lysophospholipase